MKSAKLISFRGEIDTWTDIRIPATDDYFARSMQEQRSDIFPVDVFSSPAAPLKHAIELADIVQRVSSGISAGDEKTRLTTG